MSSASGRGASAPDPKVFGRACDSCRSEARRVHRTPTTLKDLKTQIKDLEARVIALETQNEDLKGLIIRNEGLETQKKGLEKESQKKLREINMLVGETIQMRGNDLRGMIDADGGFYGGLMDGLGGPPRDSTHNVHGTSNGSVVPDTTPNEN